jgi:hypothetical protein
VVSGCLQLPTLAHPPPPCLGVRVLISWRNPSYCRNSLDYYSNHGTRYSMFLDKKSDAKFFKFEVDYV